MYGKSRIEVCVTGKEFSTEAIWPKQITKLNDDFVSIIVEVVGHDYPKLDLTRDGALGFPSDHPDSLVTGLQSPHYEVAKSWRKVSEAIGSGDYSNIPPDASGHLNKIIGFNRRHNTEAEFWEYNGARNLLAVVKPDTPFAEPAVITGTTTLYGELLRIGGDNPPTARIRFNDDETKSCPVRSMGLAREMAKRLYETIGVRGRGKWEVGSMKLHDFHIEELTEYRQTSLTNAIESLREVAGKYYEEIDDIDAFVADLRGREPEDE